MSDADKPLPWLPVTLAAVGLFFLAVGLISGGTELVGGVVFGLVSLAAAAAILYRRARDARPSEPNADAKLAEENDPGPSSES